MKFTYFTRQAFAIRRQEKQLRAAGYRRHETDWEIIRGARCKDIILDVQISVDGKSVWTRIGRP